MNELLSDRKYFSPLEFGSHEFYSLMNWKVGEGEGGGGGGGVGVGVGVGIIRPVNT